ncbi:ABC transporter substrate-binding protein [Roseomonas fluvialis]|uniref:Substrate-binding protein n=1 Tax=Roseomonas fluvialis TaxID=1750527 RepID=A0ABM7XZV2_9PROT|nr:ABC transporter substrate-binding protein [Roseomonas fluvialis]BDG71018.1 substrate-binding protein [Roseomonas fluvialis]
MRRRPLLATLAAALAHPTLAQPAAARTLRFIPIADLGPIDPIVTTTYITRNHAYLVWDTLYGLDARYRPQPQMAAGHTVEQDGRLVRITLRPDLVFHDGTQVRARDAVASIRRWSTRDGLGQTLLAETDALSAPDDATIQFRLKRPFPLLFDALAKTSPPVCFIMPERLAQTDPAVPVREAIGSGPYRFLADERVSGARVAYARFDGYRPREDGTPSGTAGPKRAWFDRVEWSVIPDASTAAAALQNNEADWWEFPTPDLLPLLRRRPELAIENPDPAGFLGVLRFNQLHAPFNDPAMRRALLPAVGQPDFMQAVAGTAPGAWTEGVGFFPPGSPSASDAGMAALLGPRDPRAARAALAGVPVTVIGPTDYPNVQALTEVGADLLRRAGARVDYAPSDWATVVQRRANRGAPAQGGWNMLFTFFSGVDFLNPAVHLMLRGNGAAAWPGWPTAPRVEALRAAWMQAETAAQPQLAREAQEAAFEELPYIPLGQFFQPTAFRRELSGMLQGPTVFWNIQRRGG